MSETAAPTETERTTAARAVLAAVFALLAPVFCIPLLFVAASWTFDRVDAGATRALASMLLLAALLLPCLQALAVFAITRSWVARALGGLIALASFPLYLALQAMASWTHH